MNTINYEYACPTCGRSDLLCIIVSAWAKLTQEEDGNLLTDTEHDDCPDHDHEWDDSTPMYCGYCGKNGIAMDFKHTDTSPQGVIMAKFYPQARIGDLVVDCDSIRPATEYPVTREILAMGKEAALSLEDDDYDSDQLKYASAAPLWVQDWNGPFRIEVADAISNYFKEETTS